MSPRVACSQSLKKVPVEFVVVVKKTERVRHGVLDDDGLDRIIGVVDVNFEFAVMAFARGFVLEIVARAVGHALYVQQERIVHSLRRHILDRNLAIEAMPRSADKINSDGLAYIDSAVRQDCNLRVKLFDS